MLNQFKQVFHLLSKLIDKSVTLAEPLHFPMIDIRTLHLRHQHHHQLVLLVPKTPNDSTNLHTVCLCNMVYLLKYPSSFDKNANESCKLVREDSDYISIQKKLLTFPLHE